MTVHIKSKDRLDTRVVTVVKTNPLFKQLIFWNICFDNSFGWRKFYFVKKPLNKSWYSYLKAFFFYLDLVEFKYIINMLFPLVISQSFGKPLTVMIARNEHIKYRPSIQWIKQAHPNIIVAINMSKWKWHNIFLACYCWPSPILKYN